MRSAFLRLLFIPVLIAAAHAAGFAYAYLALPLQAARNPLYASAAPQEPLLQAYNHYLAGALQFDFGLMPVTQLPLLATVLQATFNSFALLALAVALSIMIGRFVGQKAVQLRPPTVAPWLTGAASVGLALPGVFIGSLLIAAMIMSALWSGEAPLLPVNGFGWDAHLILPVLVLAVRPTVLIAQVSAGLLAGELTRPYIMAALARGVSWQRILARHASRVVAAPLAQTTAGALRLMLAELIVVERLFEWPGLGRLLAAALIPAQVSTSPEAPLFLYPPLVAAAVAGLACILALSDTIALLVARNADPRLRRDMIVE